MGSPLLCAILLLVLPSSSQLILKHGHGASVQAPGYDEAARAAGFAAWGTLDDNRRAAHLLLRLERERASLAVALDRRLGKQRIDAWADQLVRNLGWNPAELTVTEKGDSVLVIVQAEAAVEPGLPGCRRITLILPLLTQTLARITDLPVPMAVKCVDTRRAESTVPPAGRATFGGERYLFYLLQHDMPIATLRIDYGAAPSAFWILVGSVLVWLIVPLGVPLLVRWALLRREASRAAFAGWAWVATLGVLALAEAATLPAASRALAEIAPALPARLLRGLLLVPAALPIYLAALAIEAARYGWKLSPEGAALRSWRAALARPLIFAALALGVGLGVPALALFGPSGRWAAAALGATPLALALANLLSLRAPAGPPSPIAARFAAAAEGFLRPALAAVGLAAIVLIGLLFLTQPTTLTDFGHQIKVAEVFLTTGQIPYRDTFSWTASGQRYLVQIWLPNLFFYLAYTFGPSWLLVLYKAVLGVAVSALLALRAYDRSRSWWLAVSMAIASALVLRFFIDIRPVSCSFLCMALLLWALDRYREGRAGWVPWALPALFALWSNMHGGVIVGLAVLGIWIVGLLLGRLLLREETPPLRPLVLSAVASAAATGLNVNGYWVIGLPLSQFTQPSIAHDRILEYLSPNFHRNRWIIFEGFLLGTMVLLGLARRRSLADFLVLVALAHASLLWMRMIGFYVLAAAPVFAGALVDAAAEWREPLARLRPGPVLRALGAAALFALIVAGAWREWPAEPPDRWFRAVGDMDSFPQDAAPRLRAGEWPGRLYNPYNWGGYLIWKMAPERRVFVDPRGEELYLKNGVFEDVGAIEGGAPDWRARLNRWGIETLLTGKKGTLHQRLMEDRSGEWKKVFEGRVEVVYVRTERGRRARRQFAPSPWDVTIPAPR